MKLLARVLPIDRHSFDLHAINGFSVGVEMENYLCFKIFIPSTGGVRIADTVRWFPHVRLKLPIPSKDDDLRTTLQSSVKTIPTT